MSTSDNLTETKDAAQTVAMDGLSTATAQKRLAETGPNELRQMGALGPWPILRRQVSDTMVLILFAGAVLSFFIGERTDSFVILAILLMNGVLGFVQEWRAERALELLERMLAPHATVMRDGQRRIVAAKDLVPGDVVLLQAGDRVPADLDVLDATNAQADESALTGESVPVTKFAAGSPQATSDRDAQLFMGTTIATGHAMGTVTKTGMRTAFGEVAELTQGVDRTRSPLQHQMARLGSVLGTAAILLSLIVIAIGVLQGRDVQEMVLTGISFAVAVVPEGLPAVVTITLAFGVKAMVGNNVLLRRLQASETLGKASVICTDKTGTLTKNEMTVAQILLPGEDIEVTGAGYDPQGEFQHLGETIAPRNHGGLRDLLLAGFACNNAEIIQSDGGWKAIGAPTEAALVVLARKAGYTEADRPVKTSECPFDSDRKRMSVLARTPDGPVAYIKGAPELVLERCTRINVSGETTELTDSEKQQQAERVEQLAGSGFRILALAMRDGHGLTCEDPETVESELELLGFVGLIDPPRPEAAAAIREARAAGIRTLMMTGDAAPTARAVGRQLGLSPQTVIEGERLDALTDRELTAALDGDALFARMRPAQKMRVVDALQAEGHVVGMTGDGVNDAPALRSADVGIAMGIRGTDVAKGAADIVLLDDNYASIIAGVREGRRQYENIRKFVRYLLSSNVGEIVVIVVNLLIGGPAILIPVQILWMNLVTDGLSALALGFEPEEPDAMRRKPFRRGEALLDRGATTQILMLGAYIGVATLWLFYHVLETRPLTDAQTAAFTAVVILQKFNVFNFRSLRSPLWRKGVLTNPVLLGAVSLTIALQVVAVYWPPLQSLLHASPLKWSDWGLIVALGLPIFLVPELTKWYQQHSLSDQSQANRQRRR